MKKLFLIPFLLWALSGNAQDIGTVPNISTTPDAYKYETPIGTFTFISDNPSNNALQYTLQTSKTQSGGKSTLFTNISLGIPGNEQVNKQSIISIYPNPFTKSATIAVDPQGQVYSGQLTLLVYDMYGRKVQESEITNLKGQINRGALADGMYFYTITYENQFIGKGKFIVQ